MEDNKKAPADELDQNIDIVAKAKENKNIIIGIAVAGILLVGAALAWYFIDREGARKADEAIALADNATNDSVALALYEKAATMGHAAGNRAKAECAARLYKDGKYAEALEYLKGCKLGDKVANAGVSVLEGDCYVNLEKYDEALAAYRKAISKADGNPYIVPFVLVKEANIYRAQEQYAKEANAYRTILDQFPAFHPSGADINALYHRALAQANN